MKLNLPLAIMLAICACSAQAQTMGRLFFTPEQRAMLDVARQHDQPVTSPEEGEQQLQKQNITVNGVVRRSDGQVTVWVNNKAQQANQPQGIQVIHDKSSPAGVNLKLPFAGNQIKLKIGQSLDPASGQIEEGYHRKPDQPELPRIAPKPQPERKAAATKPATANEDDASTTASESGNAAQPLPAPSPAIPPRSRP